MRVSLIFALAISFLLTAPRASAIEPLTAEQLQQACVEFKGQADSAYSALCVYYVKGFLDGAVATDGRVAENVAAEIEEAESFTERAIRTRVGSRLEEYGPSVYAEFCVGQPDPIAEVVMHVVEELERYDDLEGVQAQNVVYASLRRHYPCEVD